MNARRTPEQILNAHPPDQRPQVRTYFRTPYGERLDGCGAGAAFELGAGLAGDGGAVLHERGGRVLREVAGARTPLALAPPGGGDLAGVRNSFRCRNGPTGQKKRTEGRTPAIPRSRGYRSPPVELPAPLPARTSQAEERKPATASASARRAAIADRVSLKSCKSFQSPRMDMSPTPVSVIQISCLRAQSCLASAA